MVSVGIFTLDGEFSTRNPGLIVTVILWLFALLFLCLWYGQDENGIIINYFYSTF